MPGRDIVVIGASAGGVEAVTQLVQGLPPDLPAAVFVVVHFPPDSVSRLPAILSRNSSLPAAHPRNGDPVQQGRIYVAPPNLHMQLRNGHIELNRGPLENRTRPAIDPLFRSAARAYGPRVIGIVLSGALGDGSMGLMVIKAHGGIAVVQDPEDAIISAMSRQAIEATEVDYILPVLQMPSLIVELTRGLSEEKGTVMAPTEMERLGEMISEDREAQKKGERHGKTSLYSCPECGGVMWQVNAKNLIHFECHTGHSWSPESLMAGLSEELESALWSAIRNLKEKATLNRQLAYRAWEAGRPGMAERFEEQAELNERHIDVIRMQLLEANPNLLSEDVIEEARSGKQEQESE